MSWREYVYCELMRCLRLLKCLHSIGIYEKAVGNIKEISEDDYNDLAFRGMEHVAPIFEMEELSEDICCGGHTVYQFSDPAVPEFYRLCRLYEHRHGIEPGKNPYVVEADDLYSELYRSAPSYFGAGYNDEVHIRELWIETCPERPLDERDIIELVHEMLEFYRSKVETLRSELLRGPVVYLPALPEHKKQTKKPRKKAAKPLKKVS